MTTATRPVLVYSFIALLALGACAGKNEAPPETASGDGQVQETPNAAQEPVEALYNKAAATLDKGEFLQAARFFDDVEREYPYSQWAAKAQMMSAYAYYKDLKYDQAVLGLERFIELHPSDENAPYAWYLKALCYYEQITDVRRDQKMTELALDNLQQVARRYPDSKYAKDASLKVDLTMDHLAGKEMEIGRYYLYRKQYQAAINRFQKVVRDYQTTTHVPEALHRLVEANLTLGIVEEAKRNAAVLGHNFPHSNWYKDTYRLFKPGQLSEPEKKSFFGDLF